MECMANQQLPVVPGGSTMQRWSKTLPTASGIISFRGIIKKKSNRKTTYVQHVLFISTSKQGLATPTMLEDEIDGVHACIANVEIDGRGGD